jgi:hypothetical protein
MAGIGRLVVRQARAFSKLFRVEEGVAEDEDGEDPDEGADFAGRVGGK